MTLCKVLTHLDVKRYYVDKHENPTHTVFANQNLTLPRLNISTFYLGNSIAKGWGGAFNDVSQTSWYGANKTFKESEVKKYGRCQTLSVSTFPQLKTQTNYAPDVSLGFLFHPSKYHGDLSHYLDDWDLHNVD